MKNDMGCPARTSFTGGAGSYIPWMQLGTIAYEKGNWEQAGQTLRRAQAGYPAYEIERKKIEQMLEKISKKEEVAHQ